MNQDVEAQLAVHRDKIDEIDRQILALMNQRITAAKSIGDIKKALVLPAFYRPEREAQVLRRLAELNQGPMPDAGVESLFREIMSVTRGTEAGLSVSVLGPEGTYTEAAARQHFGSAMDMVYCANIDEVFRATESKQTDFAVVPVENSTEGGVNATLDRLGNTSLKICGEVNFQVHHNLLSKEADLSSVSMVYAHGQSLAQCRKWLSNNLPQAKALPVVSNAEAARLATQETNTGAIAGINAVELYGLNNLARNIEDIPGNTTRFLILSNRETPPSGEDKTSLLLACHHRPGALYELLRHFSDKQIDMTKIESRPSKTGLGDYVFFIDIKGHCNDESVAEALNVLSEKAKMYRNLGSYPVSSNYA